MEQATRYTVTVFLAAPGTPLKIGVVSPRGQMYLQATEGGDTHSYGFAPPRLPPGETAKGVEYPQVRHDDADEHIDPYYSRTLEITAEHYGCLRDFAEEPAEFEFDVDRPPPSTAAVISSGPRCTTPACIRSRHRWTAAATWASSRCCSTCRKFSVLRRHSRPAS